MATGSEPRIIFADRLDGGVLVTFANGHAAIYSAALLYAMLPQAEKVDTSQSDDSS